MYADHEKEIRVLIVDDVELHRFLLKKGLCQIHPRLSVDEAASGAQAQHKLASLEYDVVLCDWMIPDLSGDQLLRWIRSRPELQRLRFVMVSGNDNEADIARAFAELGVDGYIVKPFTVERIYQEMMAVLQPGRATSTRTARTAP